MPPIAAAELKRTRQTLRERSHLSNSRGYIEATGGTLEITAKFPGATVTITSFAGIWRRTR